MDSAGSVTDDVLVDEFVRLCEAYHDKARGLIADTLSRFYVGEDYLEISSTGSQSLLLYRVGLVSRVRGKYGDCVYRRWSHPLERPYYVNMNYVGEFLPHLRRALVLDELARI